jgi:penicillin amidase
VISGSRTESGKPILANDPHLGFTAPSTFYLAHLSWEEEGNRRNVIGGTIPGVPFVIAGRNDTLAWGLTTTNLDAQDLFLEKIDENAGTYKTANGSADLSITETEIRYGKGQSEALNIRYTNNGVLLPDGYKGIGDVLPDGYGLALKWPGLASDDTTLDLLFINNRAKTVREFIAGGKYGISPMQSVVVADTSGNIGLVAKARSPRRKPENTINGRAPVPGWLDEYQWNGYVPDWQMLAVINPTEGALATANANFLPKDFKEHITYDWAEHFRQERAENLVVKRNSEHTMSVSKEIIADTHSPAMIKLRDLANRIMPAGVGNIQELREQLGEWNGKMEAEQPEPIIMLAWFRHLNINLFKDDLGDLFNKFERGRLTRIIGVLERSGSRDWCDDKTTAATESCADILEKSFDAAIKELKAEYGEDWRSWEYGAAHMAHFEHRPFGQVGALASYFNISVRSSGGPYTLRRGQTKFQFDKPYLNRHGAAFRGIYDLNDLDKSLYIQSTGQSGNFLSPHYDSLAKRWAAMDYLQMSTKPADYEKEAIGTWSFNP